LRRTARDNRDLPRPRPVKRIELDEEHTTRRLVLAVLFLAVGVVLLAVTVNRMLSPVSEWVNIEATADGGTNCASEFIFLYHLGGTDLSPREEQREVSALYTRLCQNAFQVFHNQLEFEGVNNLYAINHHPNETLTVDEALYQAFEAVERSGSRLLYLGPAYERFENVFFCEDDGQLVDFDPRASEDVAREFRNYSAFANNPQAVQIELLGENKVRLTVSQTYLEFAEQEGVESFIDFAWMRNAFIVDYLAGELSRQGYGRGALTSFDGFVRCMDGSGETYSLYLYDRQEQNVYGAAELCYQGPMSFVSLRDYPVNDLDKQLFYQTRSGEMRTPYLDPADGLCRNAVANLVCYAGDQGCGEILLKMAPVFIADEFQKDALAELKAIGINSIYCENSVIYPSDPDAVLTQLFENDEVRYRVGS